MWWASFRRVLFIVSCLTVLCILLVSYFSSMAEVMSNNQPLSEPLIQSQLENSSQVENVPSISNKSTTIFKPSETTTLEPYSQLCPTFLNSNKQIPCWLLGEGKSCYCFSLFMANWKDARKLCGAERTGNVKSNLVSLETKEEFNIVKGNINHIPELRAVFPLGYSYWTSGRYVMDTSNNESSRSSPRWEWSRTNLNGESSSTDQSLTIINYGNYAFNQVKNSLGDCLVLSFGEYAGVFKIEPNFCINPYRFICERELVE